MSAVIKPAARFFLVSESKAYGREEWIQKSGMYGDSFVMLGSQAAKREFTVGKWELDVDISVRMQINFDIFNGKQREGDKLILCIPKDSTYCKLTLDFEFKHDTEIEAAQQWVANIVKDCSEVPYSWNKHDKDSEGQEANQYKGFGDYPDNHEQKLYFEESDHDSVSEDDQEQ